MGTEGEIKLPLFLENKRETVGLLRELEASIQEVRERRLRQMLCEGCPADVLKFNTGVMVGLDHVSAFIENKIREMKTKE